MDSVFIVGGLGRIGLTAAAVLSEFYNIVIYDINEWASNLFMEHRKATFMEPGLNELLAKRKNIFLTNCISDAWNCKYIIITIGTPVDEYMKPKTRDLFSIVKSLSECIDKGEEYKPTVILRSTVAVGVTRKIEKILSNAHVAFCPERIAGGKMILEEMTLPQIVSANTEEALNSAKEFFGRTGVKVKPLASTEAGELCKLITNSYRYIEFAMANQFFCISQEFGCDFYQMMEAMKDDYPRMQNFPAPGFSGSYCLRKDTLQLASSSIGTTFSLGYNSAIINENLPEFVLSKMKKAFPNLDKLYVGVLGLAFKGNTDDTRDSLSYRMIKLLETECSKVVTHDPYVLGNQKSISNLEQFIDVCDIFILMTLHDEYKNIKTEKPIVDVWNFFGKGFGI